MTQRADRELTRIGSRDNSLFKLLRLLSTHSTAYRKLGQFWIEGDHLCQAAVDRQLAPAVVVLAESFLPDAPAGWMHLAQRTVVLPDALFDEISALQSARRVGFLVDRPVLQTPGRALPSVLLDRVQDAGNVGSILRSAAAFGFRQVLALSGTAALWSPKVLRAGMGAHFALDLFEGLDVDSALASLETPVVCTSSHQGGLLQLQPLPWPCAWAFGHEGQGLSDELLRRCCVTVRIGQPGGEESLNVAAAAAICLHASALSQVRSGADGR